MNCTMCNYTPYNLYMDVPKVYWQLSIHLWWRQFSFIPFQPWPLLVSIVKWCVSELTENDFRHQKLRKFSRWQDFVKNLKDDSLGDSRLPRGCPEVVPRLSQGCPKVVLGLSWGCTKVGPSLWTEVVQRLSWGCPKVVPSSAYSWPKDGLRILEIEYFWFCKVLWDIILFRFLVIWSYFLYYLEYFYVF